MYENNVFQWKGIVQGHKGTMITFVWFFDNLNYTLNGTLNCTLYGQTEIVLSQTLETRQKVNTVKLLLYQISVIDGPSAMAIVFFIFYLNPISRLNKLLKSCISKDTLLKTTSKWNKRGSNWIARGQNSSVWSPNKSF